MFIAALMFVPPVLAQTPPTKAPGTKSTAAKQAAALPATPSEKLLDPFLFNLLAVKAPDLFQVKFATTKGDFVVDVHRDWAPSGADRFYNLVRNGFFTDASFFRALPSFMVQFGIPADPNVAAVWYRPLPIALRSTDPGLAVVIKEHDPVKEGNKRGNLTFAMGSWQDRATQLFINLKDNTFLDSQGYAAIGSVTEGMEIVDKLYTGYGDAPSAGGQGPDQDKVASGGKAYLDKAFPKLDSIKTAIVISPDVPAVAKAPK